MDIKRIFNLVTVFAVSAFMPLFLYFNNSKEASFIEVFPVVIGFILLSCIIVGVTYVCTRDLDKSCLLASITMILFSNYSVIEKTVNNVLPMIKYWHFVLIIIFILVHIFYFVIKKINLDLIKNINKVLGIVFCGLIVFNFVFAIPNILAKSTVNKQEKSSLNYESNKNDYRNIYYLIFDEFSTTENLKKYCNYDNTNDFIKPLENMGFTVSQNSYNGSNNHYTAIITVNYANFDFITDGLSNEELSFYRENNETKKLMSSFGYNLVGVGDSQFFGIESVTSEGSNKSEAMDGSSLQSIVLKNTILYPFIREDKEQVKVILDTFEYFKDPKNYKDSSPKFTFSYLCTPHLPYFFDENGNLNDFSAAYTLDNLSAYTSTLKYVQKEIIEITKNIIKNDPEAIIILQSDHSIRFGADIDDIDKQKVLNAVYFAGEDVNEINGKSAIDTLRYVYSKELNVDLPAIGEVKK